MQPPQQSQKNQEEGSIFGKIKNCFGSEEQTPKEDYHRLPPNSISYAPNLGYSQPSHAYPTASTQYNREESAKLPHNRHTSDHQPPPNDMSSGSSFIDQRIPRQQQYQQPQPIPENKNYGRFDTSSFPTTPFPPPFPSQPIVPQFDVPVEPQVMMVEDCIVIIPKPREYFRYGRFQSPNSCRCCCCHLIFYIK